MSHQNDILSQQQKKDVPSSTRAYRKRLNSMLPLTIIIAQNVRRHRMEHDLSLVQLAEKARVSFEDLHAIENAQLRPEPEQLLALAKALDIAPSILLIEE